jgi:tetratricopeptide (TPR) repeat protein
MDALKKAEAAKRQSAEGMAEVLSQPSSVSFADMALEPLDDPTPTSTSPLVLDIEVEPEPITHQPPRAAPANLPELPSDLANLDAEFVAHHEASQAALANSPRAKIMSPEPARLAPVATILAGVASPPNSPHIERDAAERLSSARADSSSSLNSSRGSSRAEDTVMQVEREAARNVFEAKAPAAPANRRKFALVIGILSTTVTLAIAGYFWWQLQSNTGYSSTNFATRPPPPPAQTPPAPATNPTVPVAATISAASSDVTKSSNTNSTTTTTSNGQEANEDEEEERPVTAAKAPVQSAPSKKRTAAAAEPDQADDAIRLVRSNKSQLQVNPTLSKAYDEFNRGNLAAARSGYESVVKLEPNNVEALHGLAAIAVSEKRSGAASQYYERILVADPKDAAALSGLINLHGQNNPIAAESRLKGIVAEQPDSAAAQFALGNLYAAQQRWADAQQAYFKAYSVDAENPDILYNLAVSLEHMTQSKLAHQYYVLALDAAKRRPAGFDMAKVSARIAALQSQ